MLKQTGDVDLRYILGKDQKFVAEAPVHLLFVTQNKRYGELHAGFMYQNAGLYCSANNLACVVRALYDKKAIKDALHLNGDKEVVVTIIAKYKKK